MDNKFDDAIINEFKNTRAYAKLETRLLEDKSIALNKLQTIGCFEIEKLVTYQAKIKYINTLLRLVDSQKNS